MLYGTTIRIPGEFFIHQDQDQIVEPEKFVEYQRQQIRPIPASNHSKTSKIFQHKELKTCTHVNLRCDKVRAPLEQPYSEPYKVVNRVSDILYKILVEGEEKVVNIERLIPVHVTIDENTESATPEEPETTTEDITLPTPSTSKASQHQNKSVSITNKSNDKDS